MIPRSENPVFISACAGMLLFGIALITLGSIAPELMIKLDLDERAAGTLFSILPLGVLCGSIVFGPVADRYGYRIILAVSCLMLAAGFEGIAFTESGSAIRLFVFTAGFSGGVLNGATSAVVSDISRSEKTAGLSLLGVFYGIGALVMPLILGILRNFTNFENVVSAIGILSFLTGLVFLFIRFPPPKQERIVTVTMGLKMLKEKILLLLGFYLFFQGSFEAIINNWTTSYLIDNHSVSQSKALFGLTFFVAGMTLMRLAVSLPFRNVSVKNILISSFLLMITALIILLAAEGFVLAGLGLFLLGAGLASGFPVILGIAGEMYREVSATAFSIVLTIGLIGNMSVNVLMGIVAEKYGISHLITVAFAELSVMIVLAALVLRKIRP